jgi:3',5'-cyclic AMP phosphodiesterase CpdA
MPAKKPRKSKSKRVSEPKPVDGPFGEAPKKKHPEVHQLQIIHLSDVHFGSSHNFNIDKSPSGEGLPGAGVLSLSEILFRDLADGDPNCPTLVAFTGDVTTKYEEEGFKQAVPFFQDLAKTRIAGKKRGIRAIAAVPGNHDIDVNVDNPRAKWLYWNEFYNKVFEKVLKTRIEDGAPLEYVKLIDKSSEGYCVLTLNSEVHVRKGSPDQYRGQIDEQQLDRISQLLKKNEETLKRSIRIALIHHHPILIPTLVEPERNYDAVLRAGDLLTVLNKYGFHLILHGHKHWPCTFNYDNRNGYDTTYVRPMLVVAGGSIGSQELPKGIDTNCYNRIFVKWNSDNDEVRIRVETRGIIRRDSEGHPFPTRTQWYWKTLRLWNSRENICPHQLKIPVRSNLVNGSTLGCAAIFPS